MFAAAVLTFIVGYGMARSTPDYLVRIPTFVPALSIIGGIAALLFWLFIHRYVRPDLLVRRVEGLFGFEWLRVEGRSPSPGRGQLNWQIPREVCFSDRPFATIRG